MSVVRYDAPRVGFFGWMKRVFIGIGIVLIGLVAVAGIDGWLRANGFLAGAERTTAEVAAKYTKPARGFGETKVLDLVINGERYSETVTDRDYEAASIGARMPVVVVRTPVIGPMMFFDRPGYLTNTLNEPTTVLVYLACLLAGGWSLVGWIRRRRAPPTSVPITPPPTP